MEAGKTPNGTTASARQDNILFVSLLAHGQKHACRNPSSHCSLRPTDTDRGQDKCGEISSILSPDIYSAQYVFTAVSHEPVCTVCEAAAMIPESSRMMRTRTCWDRSLNSLNSREPQEKCLDRQTASGDHRYMETFPGFREPKRPRIVVCFSTHLAVFLSILFG